jgi:hypothetical protein
VKITELIFLIVVFLFYSCKDKSASTLNAGTNESNRGDTMIQDSRISGNELNPIDTAIYSKKVQIDTTFLNGSDKIHLTIKTDFDSTVRIMVPPKYTKVSGFDGFNFYESYSKVKIIENNEVLIDSLIAKKDFVDQLDSNLVNFGNLMFPTIQNFDNAVEISHSISIPLTDVGIRVSNKFNLK